MKSKKRGPGAPRVNIGTFDFSDHLRAARELLSDAGLDHDGVLQREMGKHISKPPSPSHFSGVVNGNRAVTKPFLNALHKAFVFNTAFANEPGLQKLDWSIWVRQRPDSEEDYDLVPLTVFRDLLLSARRGRALDFVRRHATEQGWIEFAGSANRWLLAAFRPETPKSATGANCLPRPANEIQNSHAVLGPFKHYQFRSRSQRG